MSLINQSCTSRQQNGAVLRGHQFPKGAQARVHIVSSSTQSGEAAGRPGSSWTQAGAFHYGIA